MVHTLTSDARSGAGQRRALLISDCHLGGSGAPAEKRREARLVDFLNHLDPAADELIILGDLFEFWFTYQSAIPRHAYRLLAALAAQRDAGLPITMVLGNHDFWGADWFRDELGIHTTDGTLSMPVGGRRAWLAHGDGLGGGDWGYKLMKRLLRNRVAIVAYRWLHPDLGIPLATRVSRASRHHSDAGGLARARTKLTEIAAPRLADGHDLVAIGHLHVPLLEHHPEGGAMAVLGDWISHFTYLEVTGGAVTLRQWLGGGKSIEQKRLEPEAVQSPARS